MTGSAIVMEHFPKQEISWIVSILFMTYNLPVRIEKTGENERIITIGEGREC